MTKHRSPKQRGSSRFERIEAKCDRIISELLVLRQYFNRRLPIDADIERIHNTALKLREQCERERNNALQMFHSKMSE